MLTLIMILLSLFCPLFGGMVWQSDSEGQIGLLNGQLYTRQLQLIASYIMNDDSHLLSEEFHLLPSDDSPGGRAKCYRNSFVLAAILHLNKL